MLLLRQKTRHGKREEGREQSLLEPVLRKWAEVDEPAEERLNIKWEMNPRRRMSKKLKEDEVSRTVVKATDFGITLTRV